MPVFKKMTSAMSLQELTSTMSLKEAPLKFTLPLPTIQDMLTQSIQCAKDYDGFGIKYFKNLITEDSWWKIYNECSSSYCALNRCYSEGKKYRNLIAKLVSQRITNGFILMELEPGCMLFDLDIITRLAKNKHVTNFTIIHHCPSRDYVAIIDETIDRLGTNEFEWYEIDNGCDRTAWAAMETLRRSLLIQYAKYCGINLNIIVTNSLEKFLNTQCPTIDLYLGLDYYDENIEAIHDFNINCAIITSKQQTLNIISCRTDGGENIHYANLKINKKESDEFLAKIYKIIDKMKELDVEEDIIKLRNEGSSLALNFICDKPVDVTLKVLFGLLVAMAGIVMIL